MKRLGLLVVFVSWYLGCASTQQTDEGKIIVIREHPKGALCQFLASEIGAERTAATVGVPIACGQAAAEDVCLLRHEFVHAKEQAAHPLGVLGWIGEWLLEFGQCRVSGRNSQECHDGHSLEMNAIIEQMKCEAGQ